MRKSSKVRISLDCSAEERNLIKALASLENKTISDYILSIAKERMIEFSSWRTQAKKKDPSTREEDNFWKSLESIA